MSDQPESVPVPHAHPEEDVELDYEADEELIAQAAEATEIPVELANAKPSDADEPDDPKQNDVPEELEEGEAGANDVEDEDKEGQDMERELESGEELEEGELSDEDEETRKERLKPQPLCRFFSKGQCTWGNSCRFKHPGVLDKGNYSMFSAPKPILPGTENLEEAVATDKTTEETTSPATKISPLKPAPVARVETAWERGLRQAKEMRKLSQQRKETDVEYEEKKTAMSLTQAELDKENDYYARQASPLHEDSFSDFEDPYEPPPSLTGSRNRRVAPPPPEDFYGYDGGNSRQKYPLNRGPDQMDSGRNERRYSEPSPPPTSRSNRWVAPPRESPPSDGETRRRSGPGGRGDEWADPWMRGGGGGSGRKRSVERRGGSNRRRRSYSSNSSRSSSGSSSSRSRSRSRRRGRRRRSSSDSSRSSRSSSGSLSRSSSPENIPRRRRKSSANSPPPQPQIRWPVGHHPGLVSKTSTSNAAPLQKRLSGLASSSIRKIKKEPVDKPVRRRRSTQSSSRSPSPLQRRRPSLPEKQVSNPNKPAVPPVISMDDSSPKRKEASSKASSSSGQIGQQKTNRAPVPPPEGLPPKQQIKLTLKSAMSTKPANRTVLEKLGMTNEDIIDSHSRKRKANNVADPKAGEKSTKNKLEKKDKKKEKKSVADRREELLKQLKAVENAIAKKRTKMDD